MENETSKCNDNIWVFGAVILTLIFLIKMKKKSLATSNTTSYSDSLLLLLCMQSVRLSEETSLGEDASTS